MRLRALSLSVIGVFLLVCALSTASFVFWFFFWTIALTAAVSLITALWYARTFRLSVSADSSTALHGGSAVLTVSLAHRCPLPVSPALLTVVSSEAPEGKLLHVNCPARGVKLSLPLDCPHVGRFMAGVSDVRCGDLFGLFRLRVRGVPEPAEFTVLPLVYEIAPLRFSPGESESERQTRAFEDATLPTDVRAYQDGDELKKVHWKLSMRRRELMVRTYEQPTRSDVLILMDCSEPQSDTVPVPFLRDSLCEAAASTASAALQAGAPVRLPILDSHPTELSAERAADLPELLYGISCCAFDGVQAFERVLLLETRRMRRTGMTAVFTSRLNPVIANMIVRIRRMGPQVRLYLAGALQTPETEQLTARLMRHDIEVVPLAAGESGREAS